MSIFSFFFDKQQFKKIICIFLLFNFSFFAYAIEITVATGINDDPPYVYGDEKIVKKYPGVTIEILQLIEKKTNITFIIKKLPWKRVVHEVKINKLDGGFHFSFKEDRKSFVAYPIIKGKKSANPKYSISNRSYSLYKLKDKKIRWDGEQIIMNPKTNIGVIRGSSITDTIITLGYKPFEVNTDLQLIKGLVKQRYSAFIALENMLDPKIKLFQLNEKISIEKLSPSVVSKPYYITFSKKFYQDHSKIAWQTWNTIELIKKSGELDKIFMKYSTK